MTTKQQRRQQLLEAKRRERWKGEYHPFRNSPIKQRIYDYLVKRPDGASTREIMDHVYMHHEDGGPEDGNVISVHIAQMKPTLSLGGMNITSTRGPAAVYYLSLVLNPKDANHG